MHGATSKKLIIPHSVEYMRICTFTRQGFIDVKCYYLPHFNTTLLLHVSVIEATGQPKDNISQGIQLYFVPNEVFLDWGLMSNSTNLENVDYNYDYRTYILACVHHHKHNHSISIPGVIWLGLSFTQPLIIPFQDKHDPKATILNSHEKAKLKYPEFVKRVITQSSKLIYDYM